jgi:hypothetical protein
VLADCHILGDSGSPPCLGRWSVFARRGGRCADGFPQLLVECVCAPHGRTFHKANQNWISRLTDSLTLDSWPKKVTESENNPIGLVDSWAKRDPIRFLCISARTTAQRNQKEDQLVPSTKFEHPLYRVELLWQYEVVTHLLTGFLLSWTRWPHPYKLASLPAMEPLTASQGWFDWLEKGEREQLTLGEPGDTRPSRPTALPTEHLYIKVTLTLPTAPTKCKIWQGDQLPVYGTSRWSWLLPIILWWTILLEGSAEEVQSTSKFFVSEQITSVTSKHMKLAHYTLYIPFYRTKSDQHWSFAFWECHSHHADT